MKMKAELKNYFPLQMLLQRQVQDTGYMWMHRNGYLKNCGYCCVNHPDDKAEASF